MATTIERDRLAGLDIPAHNAEVKQVWDAYRARKPFRVPVVLGTNTRYFLLSEVANPGGITFRQYTEDVETMFRAQLEFDRWRRFNLMQDAELGLPEVWEVRVDFQNFYEAGWLGCPIEYLNGEVPDTLPVYADRPETIMEGGLPDPFGRLMARVLEYEEAMRELAARAEFMGRPVRVGPGSGMGTDGPFTVACNLFGPDVVCLMLMEEPDRLQTLLAFLTEAIIARLYAWHEHWGYPKVGDGRWLADDSVSLLSLAQYTEHVLPHHRRYFDAIATPVGRGVHLCGRATHLFPTIVRELGVQAFDTGFPVDHGALREALGPDVEIAGGPHVEFLLHRTPTEIEAETRRVLESGVLRGGRFVLREGNNLAPGTPLENTEAMVMAGRRYGRMQ